MTNDLSRAVDQWLAPSTDPLQLYRYRDGLYAVDLLTAAVVHLDFFTWLRDHPSSLADLAAHYGFAERPVDVLLTLATANGLVTQTGGVFSITELAREHLVTGSLWNLAPYYASLGNRPIVRDFLAVLSTDKPAGWGGGQAQADWHRAMETEEFSRAFTLAMDCRGRYLGQALAARVDVSQSRALLDLGGGSGIYACAFCARYPNLRATVFEQRPVDAIARRNIHARGFGERVDVATGDLFRDALPDTCDVHLFSNVLHDWGVPEVRTLLSASRRALPAGGLLIIHDAFINAEKSGPRAVAEYSALLMHSTQGKCYATSEYAALLRDAGFIPGEYHDTAADRGVMTAVAV